MSTTMERTGIKNADNYLELSVVIYDYIRFIVSCVMLMTILISIFNLGYNREDKSLVKSTQLLTSNLAAMTQIHTSITNDSAPSPVRNDQKRQAR